MGKPQIIAITGLRRVGKSVLVKQLLQTAESPAYFSFDEEETQSREVLRFVIDFMIGNLNAKCIALDEVQYVDDWQGILKRYYGTKNAKFIISGSESLEIKKARESLAGRIVEFELGVLSFEEYLKLKEKKIKPASYAAMLPEKEFLEREFINYLYGGCFPEIANEGDEENVRKYIWESVVKKIIYEDIPRIFEVKRRDLLLSLFRYACNNSAGLFDIRNLSNMLNADYDTVANYLFYLHEAFLVKTAETYSKSMAKRLRRNKKLYVAHPAIAFAVLGYKKEMLVEKILGQYVESLFGGEFFWRDKHKNEVDVVVDGKPIEIKYRNNISAEDLKGLLRFMEEFGVNEGIVITKNIYKEEQINGKKVAFIPAWYYLLTKTPNKH